MNDAQQVMAGGNMNAVVRDGDTVRRIGGPWTPTVHRYLQYLRRGGIDWGPEPLDFDGTHETLSFIDGIVPAYPLPSWVWTDAALEQGARMLRRLHDASIGFPLDEATWQSSTKVPVEMICHNDFSPHNLAFRDGAIIGAIDFDMCSPGPRIWDIAYYATRMVPLTGEPPHGAPSGADAPRRIQLLLDAYGSDAGSIPLTVEAVMQVAIRRLYELADFSRLKAVELNKPELRDDADEYERDAEFLSRK
ncbi:phosphotransferase [Microbacterium sp. Mu-80]|uniref:Phosphotransferase n=1 Tax=Microbacterium bandirmense TaxID=3122050 RepID=A0ABU8L7Q4_9MICO